MGTGGLKAGIVLTLAAWPFESGHTRTPMASSNLINLPKYLSLLILQFTPRHQMLIVEFQLNLIRNEDKKE